MDTVRHPFRSPRIRHGIVIFILFTADHRRILELATAFRRLDHQRGCHVSSIEMPLLAAAWFHDRNVQGLKFVGAGIEPGQSHHRARELSHHVTFVQRLESRTLRDQITGHLPQFACAFPPERMILRVVCQSIRLIIEEVGTYLGRPTVGQRCKFAHFRGQSLQSRLVEKSRQTTTPTLIQIALYIGNHLRETGAAKVSNRIPVQIEQACGIYHCI